MHVEVLFTEMLKLKTIQRAALFLIIRLNNWWSLRKQAKFRLNGGTQGDFITVYIRYLGQWKIAVACQIRDFRFCIPREQTAYSGIFVLYIIIIMISLLYNEFKLLYLYCKTVSYSQCTVREDAAFTLPWWFSAWHTYFPSSSGLTLSNLKLPSCVM